MNNDSILNDTFDNFTFSEAEKLINETTHNNGTKTNLSSNIFDDSSFFNNLSLNTEEVETKLATCSITEEFSKDPFTKNESQLPKEKEIKPLASSHNYNSSRLETGHNSSKKSTTTQNFTPKNSKKTSSCKENNDQLDKEQNKIPNQTIKGNELLQPTVQPIDNKESSNKISDLNQSLKNKNLNHAQNKTPTIPSKKKDPIEQLLPQICEIKEKQQTENKYISPKKCKLANWGLPEAVLEKYYSRKLINMFPWQAECLSNANVLQKHKNLVYSAPTSAGKTLVSEILAIKTLFERKKKVLFILPFVSIVREKMYYFQDLLGSSGIRVEGYMGSYNPPGGFQSIQFAICTMEKANSLINRLLEEGKLDSIGGILVDEMHLLGDSSRGYLLELLLTKLIYIQKKSPDLKIQIIGMSATLPNLPQLAKWLDAELYTTTFRPIPLYEQVYIAGEIFDNKLNFIRKLNPVSELQNDTDDILQLCLETIADSCSVLIFCPTKNWCETLAQQIAAGFFKLGNTKTPLGDMLRSQITEKPIVEVLEQLKFCPVGLDSVLKRSVSFGVAFHHAGLTMDERDIVEAGFRNGAIRILIATSTLSSGVNLPARRVIIRTPMFFGKPIDSLVYKQMIGRAGRMGKDEVGESIVICQKQDRNVILNLLSAQLEPVESCLEGSGKLKRAILEVIASGVACSPEDVNLFTKCTLLAAEEDSREILNPIEESLNFLINNEFIRLQDNKYIATSLAKACLSSSMPPEEGLALFTELEKARECFVLETELHLIYLITPYSACYQWGNIDWMLYLEIWEKLPVSMKKVGELVGVRDSYLIGATRGRLPTNTTKLQHKLLIHKRFFVALALQDLVNEKSLNYVCHKFHCNRGLLQSLQQSASSFAGMVTSFSKQLGWSSVEVLFSQFQDRLQFGVSRDLIDLMKLPILNGKIARILYNAGVQSVIELANSGVEEIEEILYRATPFESEKVREGESEFERNKRNQLRNVWITGKEGLTNKEAAEILVNEARTYLKKEMGLADAKWEHTKEPESTELISPNCSKNVITETSIEKVETKQNNSIHDIQTDNLNISNSSSLFENSIKDNNLNSLISSENNNQLIVSNSSFNCNNLNASAKLANNSDSSLLSDSLGSMTLELSIGKNSSQIQTSKEHINNSVNIICSGSDLENIFAASFNPSQKGDENIKIISQDVLVSSSEEEVLPQKRKSKKRSRISNEFLLSSSKKCKSQLSPKNEIETDLNKIDIVHVCSSSELFELFKSELKKNKLFALSAACIKHEEGKNTIGCNIVGNHMEINKNAQFVYKNIKMIGMSIYWGSKVVYYINFEDNPSSIEFFEKIFNKKSFKIIMFDAKEHINILNKCCNVNISNKIEDPKIADWILDPEDKEKNLTTLVSKFCPEVKELVDLLGNCGGTGSVALNLNNTLEPLVKSSIESFCVWMVMLSLKKKEQVKFPNFRDILENEMGSVLCLAKNEICGIPVKKTTMQKLVDELKYCLSCIEKKAFSMAGRHFSFTSSTDVAKVIGIYKGKKVSTKKQILQQNEHPLSNLIMQWRKINSTLTKMIYPLIRSIENDRIYGHYISHTSTGRISMQEPNLQSIAKDFEYVNPITQKTSIISCRSAFEASDNCFLVSADYCQLELRILAHLSEDRVLKNILSKPGDVFKSIAAKWNGVREEEVTEDMRQHTKHLCYGMIYGIGFKGLAEQLNIEEDETLEFMETFKNTYPDIKKYMKETIEFCKVNGYVETLLGRKRFLKHIVALDNVIRSQAERQAINTTIQGSAADIAKKAMIKIDGELNNIFGRANLVLHLHDELIYEVQMKDVRKVASIIKNCMENTVRLSVPLPVKLKTGKSWGQLKEFTL